MLNYFYLFAKINLVIEMEYRITSRSESETIELAQNFESEKFPNMVICLIGDLGSGKTTFTKGFAGALGIQDVITSPTFTIIKEYEDGEMPLYHMDVYRLEDGPKDINFDEYFHKNGVTIIEWADMIRDELPSERLEVKIAIIDDDVRVFIIKPIGKMYEDVCEAVL